MLYKNIADRQAPYACDSSYFVLLILLGIYKSTFLETLNLTYAKGEQFFDSKIHLASPSNGYISSSSALSPFRIYLTLNMTGRGKGGKEEGKEI